MRQVTFSAKGIERGAGLEMESFCGTVEFPSWIGFIVSHSETAMIPHVRLPPEDARRLRDALTEALGDEVAG